MIGGGQCRDEIISEGHAQRAVACGVVVNRNAGLRDLIGLRQAGLFHASGRAKHQRDLLVRIGVGEQWPHHVQQ
ncbi:MAG: hypothetical protein RL020_507 [Pseudomonadota bacterium]